MVARHPVHYTFREYVAHDGASSTKHEFLDGQIDGRTSADARWSRALVIGGQVAGVDAVGARLDVDAIYEDAREPSP